MSFYSLKKSYFLYILLLLVVSVLWAPQVSHASVLETDASQQLEAKNSLQQLRLSPLPAATAKNYLTVEISSSPVNLTPEPIPAPQTLSESHQEKTAKSSPSSPTNQNLSEKAPISLTLEAEHNKNNTEITEHSNVLINGDFSQKNVSPPKSHWSEPQAPSAWSAYVDSKQSQDPHPIFRVTANGELIIESSVGLRGAVTQQVNINPNHQYDVSFEITTKDRTGQAFVRIIEDNNSDPKKKRIWLSPMTMGNSSHHSLHKLYKPKNNVSKVTLELYFESGTGKAIFQNISMTDCGTKHLEHFKPVTPVLPTSLQETLDKQYVFPITDYHYQIDDTSIAQIKGGMLHPLKEGQATVTVTDQKRQQITTIPLTILPSASDKYSQLIEDWNTMTLGNNYYNHQNRDMRRLFNQLETNVTKAMTTFNQASGRTALWSDLSDYTKSDQITATYRRLEEIAKQITTPGSVYYQNEQAIRVVREGLAWLNLNVYNSNQDIEGGANWWDYEIGVPRALLGSLTLLNSYFSQSEMMTLTDTIEHFVPNSNYFRMTLVNPFPALGGNLVDMGRVKVLTGLIRKDATIVKETTASLGKLFQTVTNGNGFYTDGSYIDHTHIAYTGAYGNVLIDGLAQLLPIIQKTDTPFTPNQINHIYQWIDQSFLPIIIKGQLMDMTRGRSISREASSTHAASVEVLRALLRIANMDQSTRNQVLKAQIKNIIAADTYYDTNKNLKSYIDIAAVEKLKGDTNLPKVKSKTYLKTYNSMDKLVYYNSEKDFGFGLSLYSDRTQNYEAMNNENTRGWYTSDGMFYLYNNDLAHYSDNFWPTVNPYKLPGTTETNQPRQDATTQIMKGFTQRDQNAQKETGQVVNPSDFVGSLASSTKNGLAAMQFSNWNQSLSAKKAWAILDDKIVFLGTAIQTNQDYLQTQTTIDQRRVDSNCPYRVYINGQVINLSDGAPHQLDKVSSIFLETSDPKRQLAYLFDKPTNLTIQEAVQSGKWSTINQTNTNQQLQKQTYITITQTHTKTDDTYAYTLYPNISRPAFEAIKQQPIRIITNTSQQQIIYDQEQKLWSIIKYDHAPLTVEDNLTIEKAGLYQIQRQGNHYQLVFYQPQTKEKTEQTVLHP
ncbi:polysaccharide lyase 8 family protein [Streptococcus halichoeri]|uniref:polysaccharide lyase 8 family protein n=1 Tax=Streptococcus halichoeri TaxID=254785 RepID=UPI00135C1252|nr:polysaccharide lyase 8 family protein [Streptococcus halichoeri]